MAKRIILPQLTKAMPRGMAFAPEIVSYLEWLEDRYGAKQYRMSQQVFLPALPVAHINQMQSHLAFQTFDGLTEAWFGEPAPVKRLRDRLRKPKPTRPIFPFCKCGADGSVIALWHPPKGTPKYVFMGSEGEAFTLAEDPVNFLILLTLGYSDIAGRDSLQYGPDLGREHPAVAPARDWVKRRFKVDYPPVGEDLLQYFEIDPFTLYVG